MDDREENESSNLLDFDFDFDTSLVSHVSTDRTCIEWDGKTEFIEARKKFRRTQFYDRGENIRIKPSCPIPQRIRAEFTLRLIHITMPALIMNIDSLYYMTDPRVQVTNFRERVLNKVHEISRRLVDLIYSFLSIRAKWSLTSYPEYIPRTFNQDWAEPQASLEEPSEEFSSLPWVNLALCIDRVLETLVEKFREHAASLIDTQRNHRTTQNCLSEIYRTRSYVMNHVKTILDSDLKIYMDRWKQMGKLPFKLRRLDRMQKEISSLDPHTIEGFKKLHMCRVGQSMAPMMRLASSMFRKLSTARRTSDALFIKQMDAYQLHALMRETGIYIPYYPSDAIILSFWPEAMPSFTGELNTFEVRATLSPRDMAQKPEPNKPGRALLSKIDQIFRGIFKILNLHLDRLLACPKYNSNPELIKCIQASRGWCANWKSAYNIAVHVYLERYRDVYWDYFENSSSLDKRAYYGDELE